VDKVLRETCEEISNRYEINFLEIGVDENHVHFLIQTIPTLSPTKVITIIKSITAREIIKKCADLKKQLWGAQLWSDGYFVSTVGKHGNEQQIESYVKNQGKTYTKIFKGQITMF
jgi:REP element-mobilizing transposase RayT